MTPRQRDNLKRLLQPRHIAVVGGRDAEAAINECRRIGFAGKMWPVNPKRESLGRLACYAGVDDLPDAPDAVFLAVPPAAATDITARLARRGAGGVVCYTAGFGGDGDAEGGASDRPLADAAGEMAVVGPNCYGVINYINKVALWPFAHGGDRPGRGRAGAAIITQSGMLSSDITMNRRSLPLAFMISAGNQSVLGLEDYIDVLCERDEVGAIGLHIEGLKDIAAFSRAARKALERNKPVVALKTGTSPIGARLTLSHTGSLSGVNELYQALFERLGIISVDSPVQLLETLKFICVAGIPNGNRVVGFTCSGGGATLLADGARRCDHGALEFPPPSKRTADAMRKSLPAIAEVSNPLDYTTPIWGVAEKVRPVFDAALGDRCDAALIVQDFPLPGVDESKPSYLSDTKCFIAATAAAGVPGAVCSTLPENIDRQTREFLVANRVAPLQGIGEAVNAVSAAAWYGRQRAFALRYVAGDVVTVNGGEQHLSDEWSGKAALRSAGLAVPHGRLADGDNAARVAGQLGFPVALKVNHRRLAHKTEIGAVRLGLSTAAEVEAAVQEMRDEVGRADPAINTDCFLLEQMAPPPLAEMLVAVRAEPQFGLVLTLAAGGVWAEMLADAVTLLLPVSEVEILAALDDLSIAPLLNGFRAQPAADKNQLAATIKKLADHVIANRDSIAEIEINPLFVFAGEVCAVDALMHTYGIE